MSDSHKNEWRATGTVSKDFGKHRAYVDLSGDKTYWWIMLNGESVREGHAASVCEGMIAAERAVHELLVGSAEKVAS